MSNDEGHTDLFESHRADPMERNKEDSKNNRKSKRMEGKTEKPKRHYKKRTPKPTAAAATASPVQQQQKDGGENGGESKPNRNRITKRDHGTSKKRTRPTKPPVLEAELLNPTGGPSKILQLDPRKFIPIGKFFPYGQSPFCGGRSGCWEDNEDGLGRWECSAYHHHIDDDDDDDGMSDDSDYEECTLSDIGDILKEILVEFRKHSAEKHN